MFFFFCTLISHLALQDFEQMQLFLPPSEKPLKCLKVSICLSALLIEVLLHWRVSIKKKKIPCLPRDSKNLKKLSTVRSSLTFRKHFVRHFNETHRVLLKSLAFISHRLAYQNTKINYEQEQNPINRPPSPSWPQ